MDRIGLFQSHREKVRNKLAGRAAGYVGLWFLVPTARKV